MNENSFPEFMTMSKEELEARIDVIWQMRIPDGDSARNVDPDIYAELQALEFALSLCAS